MKSKEYKYVDFHSKSVNGGQWIRTTDTQPLVQASSVNVFQTVQKFKNEVPTEGEYASTPLYFDIDYEGDLDVALDTTRKLIAYFKEELKVDKLAIRTWFSGSKGFHILMSPDIFDMKPNNYAHKVNKFIANYLNFKLSDNGLNGFAIDESVYSSRRMWRINNTLHATTKLYKIELEYDEVMSLTIEEIKELAVKPRLPLHDTKTINSAERYIKEATEFYEKCETQFKELSILSKPANDLKFKFDKNNPPVCVSSILKKRWISGQRNQTSVQLAVYFKFAGFTEVETVKKLSKWIQKHSTEDTEDKVKRRIANTKTVVRTIFSSDTYVFGCAFIRSLNSMYEGEDDYVQCSGNLCPCIVKADVTDTSIKEVELSDTGNSEYCNKIVKTKVMVAGKKSTPYIVPFQVTYTCYSKCEKSFCPLYNMPNKVAYKELTTKDRELIMMCGVTDNQIVTILRDISGIKKCGKYEVKVTESVNVEELLVIPMATGQEQESYVLRKIYSAGPIDVTENRYYEVAGYVFPHPKNQEGTVLIQSARPLQDVITQFGYNGLINRELRETFHGDNDGIDRIEEVVKSLTSNVTGIVERDDVLLGCLLTYHSSLKLRVPWDSEEIRGWVECIIVGDTGTGKSALIEKLMKSIGIGHRINAESTTRTGLTYKMEQSSSGSWYIVWGSWVLADRELIWIDEASSLPKEEYGMMTLARSSGKLEVKRAVTAETNCRVRAILSTNAAYGKRLADYVHGCETLKQLFNNEDIRRFDFGLFLKSTDVPLEYYNTLTKYEKIDIEQIKKNVLYSWSRTPDQIVFTEEAIKSIQDTSMKLSKEFGSASEVPLVSPSDQRNKMARLSSALANFVHNVDESGETTIVTEKHVEYIYRYLRMIYKSSGCNLHNYANMQVKEEPLTQEKFEKIKEYLSTRLPFLRSKLMFDSFIKIFSASPSIRQNDLEASLNIDKQDVKTMIHLLGMGGIKLIAVKTNGIVKTPRFNTFIERCFKLGIVDDDEMEKDELDEI